MLKLLRDKKLARKIWIILTIMVLPAFLFWGIVASKDNNKQTATLGEIFGRKISASEYKDAYDAVRNLAIIRYGDKFFEIESQLNLNAQTWQRLILLHEARQRKINISDRQVIETIEGLPFFQYKGNFNNRIYNDMLQYFFHAQPRAFEEQTRQNLMVTKLYDQVTQSVTVSEDELRQAYSKAHDQGKKDNRLDEKKYLSEKDAFKQVLIEEKKQELFAKFTEELVNKAQIK
jgi:hypothetical protein